MNKSTQAAVRSASLLLLGMAFAAAALPAHAQPQQILGSDAAACQPGGDGHAALVRVTGFKDRRGRLRLQYYANDPKTWLASGAYLRRQEVPMTAEGDMFLCITVPEPGSYAFVVLQDRDEDGRLSVWSDGVGFSNNPKLYLAKPKIERIATKVGSGVTPIAIVMNYRFGLAVRPLDPAR
jgi:uncharacterized protein (DUF2141 family)